MSVADPREAVIRGYPCGLCGAQPGEPCRPRSAIEGLPRGGVHLRRFDGWNQDRLAAEDERRKSVLFNDVTHAPIDTWLHFSDRLALRDYLWEQGWRRDVRPEDVTE